LDYSFLQFDKNFLFDGKSIRKEKDRIKEKNRAEERGWKVSSEENGIMQDWT
jgi:hypothetical protein